MAKVATAQKMFTQEEAPAAMIRPALRSTPVAGLPANDSLFRDLEQRYGAVFAQWVIDRM